MSKGRLEAFSDGVLAIIITIMVLELHAPHEEHTEVTYRALIPLVPIFLSYVLSFLYVGIYWNNHHHMLHAASHVTGPALWANLHLLFWLSLVPFATSWLGDSHFAHFPVFLYGLFLLMCGVAWEILRRILLASHAPDSPLHRALRRNWKELLSILAYVVALPLAFFLPRLSCAIYLAVAIVWFIPDKRVERELNHKPATD